MTNEINAVGIRFKKAGKIHFYTTNGLTLNIDDNVIVNTIRGVELGYVVLEERLTEVSEEEDITPIIRIATPEDMKTHKKNIEDQNKALEVCEQKVAEFKLPMNLIDVEYTFDRTKLLFYFTAEGRIDFRELVKSLASIFRTRIELRQIGVRDEAKILNSIGMCGRTLCCSTFLYNFQTVSLKMAKDQNLSLNPSKISGSCGRLMCCLNYEQEAYEELNVNLPNIGDIVKTPKGNGEVMSVSILRQTVKVILRDKKTDEVELVTFNKNEVKVIKAKKYAKKLPFEDGEKVDSKELKGLLDE